MIFEILSPNVLSAFRDKKISTSTVVDILDELGTGSVLTSKIKPINCDEPYLVAQAYTVSWKMMRKGGDIQQCQPSTWELVGAFLVPELKRADGLVYVAGGGPLITEAALAGGMSCTYFEKIGFAGVILGGAVRDMRELNALNIPVLASNPIPTDTQGAYMVAETGTHCLLEHVTVHSGDLIVVDTNGIAVIPVSATAQVIQKALAIDNTENIMLKKIRAGERLPELINLTGRI
ncbi:RraA family protein [Yersinia similis]|uniref:Putative 4-hydroxy-4-methyl-2-oxoglutarate aldolase n=1 Tax=Yersinia similis TaxID=367190 RepID=A0A0T9QUH6_9GAMM|nr:RraA family protein [Yersinia similis]CFQ70925.1 RraA family [Yersinia similis]CNC09859.1 RraA family [Yersinia similis]CNF56028.1 RraA family [Yersinia similis]CNF57318.1 RraA family [Yersinia similis]CNI29387.1 RraA family [Yersinia similis]